MSELVLLNLVHRRCGRILIANRTPVRARELARRFGAEPTTMERLQAALAGADLVISCTASEGVVLAADDVRRAAAKRQGRPLMLVDIAVPRDLDSEIAASLTPRSVLGHRGEVSIAGAAVGPLSGDAHSSSGLRFRLREIGGTATVRVLYRGSVPDLFRLGRHVFLRGQLHGGVFEAVPGSMMTQCPSKYVTKGEA
jgi:hypothetical protein